jgi:chromosome segregation ATPase
MDPKRVELLADRIREKQKATSGANNVRKHLDAARAKLETLQAARQDLKRDLALCLEERDAARRDVARLQSRQKPHVVTACDVHEALIDKLQKERAFLLQALEEVVGELTADGDSDIGVTADRARESLYFLQRLDRTG